MRKIFDLSPATRSLELVSPTSLTIFRRSYTRLCNRIATNSSRVPTTHRVFWVVQDRKKFSSLVDTLRELVDGLVNLLQPTVQSVGNRIIENDIANLGTSHRRLFVEACREEDTCREWSSVASEAINASVDHRVVEKLMEDQGREVSKPPATTILYCHLGLVSMISNFIAIGDYRLIKYCKVMGRYESFLDVHWAVSQSQNSKTSLRQLGVDARAPSALFQ